MKHGQPQLPTCGGPDADRRLTVWFLLLLLRRAAAHIIMLNGYDGALPNTTLETVYNGQSQLFYGNSNGPSFESGNYPLVRRSQAPAPGAATILSRSRGLRSCAKPLACKV